MTIICDNESVVHPPTITSRNHIPFTMHCYVSKQTSIMDLHNFTRTAH